MRAALWALGLLVLLAGTAAGQTTSYGANLTVTLPDGSELSVPPGETASFPVEVRYRIQDGFCPASPPGTNAQVALDTGPLLEGLEVAFDPATLAMPATCQGQARRATMTLDASNLGEGNATTLEIEARSAETSCGNQCTIDEARATTNARLTVGGQGLGPWWAWLGGAAVAATAGVVAVRMRRQTGGPAGAAAATSTRPSPGERFLDKYDVDRQLGRGSYGTTWLAHHAKLDRQVVIKQLHAHWSSDDEVRARFEREGKVMASLDHPHVTRIYDVEEVANAWYLVMEYVDGGSLGERIDEGPLDAEEADRIIAAVLDGLAHLHERGIVHRDLKPENVLLTANGTVRIADFGVAYAEEADAALTATGAMPGTPLYMAPEQLRGEGDHRCDLYATAALYYRLVTGRFYLDEDEEGSFALLSAIVGEEPDLPLDTLAKERNAWLARGLAKDPDDRFPSAQAMAEALDGTGEHFSRGSQ